MEKRNQRHTIKRAANFDDTFLLQYCKDKTIMHWLVFDTVMMQ